MEFHQSTISCNKADAGNWPTAQLNFPQRRFTFGFYGPGPACVPSHPLEKTIGAAIKIISPLKMEELKVEELKIFVLIFKFLGIFWKNSLKNYKNSKNLPKIWGFCDDVIIGQNPPPPSSGDDVICERPLIKLHATQ